MTKYQPVRGEVERAKGIEPSALAWEARVLPLYDAREGGHSTTPGHCSTMPKCEALPRRTRRPGGRLGAGRRSRRDETGAGGATGAPLAARSELTSPRQHVYNAPMDIPTALLYSIIGSIAEMALEPSTAPESGQETVAIARTLPPEARQGGMQPPAGDGLLIINGRQWPLAPTAQFRSLKNLLVMPMQIQTPVEVVYLPDASGAIFRVWMLTPSEASTPRPR